MAVLDHIVSYVDGRIRLRHPALKDASLATMVTSVVTGVDGINSAEVNPRLGSLLIYYDPQKLDRSQLLTLAEQGLAFLPDVPEKEKRGHSVPPSRPAQEKCFGQTLYARLTSREINRMADRFMLGSLLFSLTGAALGRSSLHVIAGGLFTVAGIQHIIAHRKAL